ncbi:MAG TPA: nuclear transport factor 2 family protein [Terriglobales bacterium]|nr:nuclear transport factor 2 family protein [Terriglobales bacterium]
MSVGPSTEKLKANMERIYHDWDKALSENDAEALLQLYASDGVIESPLMPHLMAKEEGICRGHGEMRPFF